LLFVGDAVLHLDANGAVKGTIKGDAFAKAFLAMWLGADPLNQKSTPECSAARADRRIEWHRSRLR
jgi:hypothetical protein